MLLRIGLLILLQVAGVASITIALFQDKVHESRTIERQSQGKAFLEHVSQLLYDVSMYNYLTVDGGNRALVASKSQMIDSQFEILEKLHQQFSHTLNIRISDLVMMNKEHMTPKDLKRQWSTAKSASADPYLSTMSHAALIQNLRELTDWALEFSRVQADIYQEISLLSELVWVKIPEIFDIQAQFLLLKYTAEADEYASLLESYLDSNLEGIRNTISKLRYILDGDQLLAFQEKIENSYETLLIHHSKLKQSQFETAELIANIQDTERFYKSSLEFFQSLSSHQKSVQKNLPIFFLGSGAGLLFLSIILTIVFATPKDPAKP